MYPIITFLGNKVLRRRPIFDQFCILLASKRFTRVDNTWLQTSCPIIISGSILDILAKKNVSNARSESTFIILEGSPHFFSSSWWRGGHGTLLGREITKLKMYFNYYF